MNQEDTPMHAQIWSIPNLISISRLVVMPILIILIIDEAWLPASLLAGFLGFTDFLDGYVARKFKMMTALGAILDPLVDRIFILGLMISMVVVDIVSLLLFFVLIARDIFVLLVNYLKNKKLTVTVIYLGKMGTWVLYVTFGVLLLSRIAEIQLLEQFGLASMVWGSALYWLAAFHYIYSSRLQSL